MELFKRSLVFVSLCVLFSSPAAALDDNADGYDPAEKARQSHEKAASDMMYQNEEWKAMYYQNQQIIQLLKEIRDSLDMIKTRVAVKDVEK